MCVNIILVSDKMARARTLPLWLVVGFLSCLVLATALLTALILPQAKGGHQGYETSLSLRLVEAAREDAQSHLNALAMQLGEVQARMLRLDALSDRLADLAGVRDKELQAEHAPGRGGLLHDVRDISEQELAAQLDQLLRDMDTRSERLEVLEALLLQQNFRKITRPAGSPVDAVHFSSGFGRRIDPFTGRLALHEGLDFAAEIGTPIRAVAGGIVTQAEHVADYGNIVKLDHGSGLETRYAHASRLLVRAGERVKRGQIIAEVGNTGRSTAPHLHFEVRLNGVALDPRKYLKQFES